MQESLIIRASIKNSSTKVAIALNIGKKIKKGL